MGIFWNFWNSQSISSLIPIKTKKKFKKNSFIEKKRHRNVKVVSGGRRPSLSFLVHLPVKAREIRTFIDFQCFL
ncbi:hypothetical protein B9Z55_018052 [Caenorhabditis nigoni]|uniref:Uncharacterized protein n=1 Tax=Caenorhabditis nigoni TaxID=1611254 RepID=A0A2G5TCZ8_9PELO|nr:hypothetical protein B9Z55_018052 [Caenorhabditis nigoni]